MWDLLAAARPAMEAELVYTWRPVRTLECNFWIEKGYKMPRRFSPFAIFDLAALPLVAQTFVEFTGGAPVPSQVGSQPLLLVETVSQYRNAAMVSAGSAPGVEQGTIAAGEPPVHGTPFIVIVVVAKPFTPVPRTPPTPAVTASPVTK